MHLQAALQHFQAMVEGDPLLAGQVGNEQIKTRAASQVLQVSAACCQSHPFTPLRCTVLLLLAEMHYVTGMCLYESLGLSCLLALL